MKLGETLPGKPGMLSGGFLQNVGGLGLLPGRPWKTTIFCVLCRCSRSYKAHRGLSSAKNVSGKRRSWSFLYPPADHYPFQSWCPSPASGHSKLASSEHQVWVLLKTHPLGLPWWLRLLASTAGGMASILSWGIKILHASWPKKKKNGCHLPFVAFLWLLRWYSW